LRDAQNQAALEEAVELVERQLRNYDNIRTLIEAVQYVEQQLQGHVEQQYMLEDIREHLRQFRERPDCQAQPGRPAPAVATDAPAPARPPAVLRDAQNQEALEEAVELVERQLRNHDNIRTLIDESRELHQREYDNFVQNTLRLTSNAAEHSEALRRRETFFSGNV